MQHGDSPNRTPTTVGQDSVAPLPDLADSRTPRWVLRQHLPFLHLSILLLVLLSLTACSTPDYTTGQPATCEVHHLAMTKRTVPIAYGMIPMSKAAAEQGEWKRRQEQYPHPGDCLPATDLNLTGETKAQVYVCPQCEKVLHMLTLTN